MATIVIDPTKECLRLSCGECCETNDFIFEVIDGKIHIDVPYGEHGDEHDHAPECFITPVHMVI